VNPVALTNLTNESGSVSQNPIRSSLDIYTNYVTPFQLTIPQDRLSEACLNRFILQESARKLLWNVDFYQPAVDEKNPPLSVTHRVCFCLRRRLNKDTEVRVHQRSDSHTYYSGLIACGSVWSCPICAARVAERRRGELIAAIAAWRALGGDVLLMTTTVPHTRSDDAVGLLNLHNDTYRRFWRGEPARRLRESLGMVGFVRALEVTHGDHGWHPHGHTLLFVRAGLNLEDAKQRLWGRWESLLNRVGVNPSSNAFDLQDGSKAARYATKFGLTDDEAERRWGIAGELTRANTKRSKARGGRTPFQLLEDYTDGDKQAGALFVEFSKVFRGRRQLQWSNGLRSLLLPDSEEVTDEEIAQTVQAEDELLGSVQQWWSLILRFKLRGQVLQAARAGGIEAVRALVAPYEALYPLRKIPNEVISHVQQKENPTAAVNIPMVRSVHHPCTDSITSHLSDGTSGQPTGGPRGRSLPTFQQPRFDFSTGSLVPTCTGGAGTLPTRSSEYQISMGQKSISPDDGFSTTPTTSTNSRSSIDSTRAARAFFEAPPGARGYQWFLNPQFPEGNLSAGSEPHLN
jgi:hypothetical protein